MPLTAEDVKNKQFTPTRFKGGYDEKEVDDFLDEVEAELTRLYRENTDLRARLQVAEQGARQPGTVPGGPPVPPAPLAPPTPPASFTIPPAAPAPPQAAVAPPAPPPPLPPAAFQAPPAPPAPAAASEATQEAAMRMLAMAQKTAEETVADAKRDADRVLGEARAKADQLERETQERHRSVVGNLDGERERLERKIEELRSFEREYRARLKSYLEGQLRDLDGRAEGVQPTAPRPVAAAVPAGVGAATSSGFSAGASAPAAAAPPPSTATGSTGFVVPPAAQPPRPPSPFSPMPAPPGAGGAPSSGPSGPPRQPSGGGFEVDEGPEVPSSNG
jgi:DivIVA domain-containing protein